MEKTWFCQFKEERESITVGTPLILLCDGEPLETPLKTDNLSIQFLETKYNYSLVLLKNLKIEKGFTALKVTSYKTGFFNSPFYITDGEQFIKIENLSFQVQSVLTENDKEPYPPFGPFLTETPYFLFSIFSMSCFLLLLGMFFYRFFKRTRFVKKVSRKSLTPSKAFNLKLRQEAGDLKNTMIHLEKNFRTFLEEQLLIPAKDQKIEQITKNLKKYHPKFYKKSGAKIKQLLGEFSVREDESPKTYRKLKKISQDLVFSIEEELK